MSGDSMWWPSAEIYGSQRGARNCIETMHEGEKPRRGQITYRNIRGPFAWEEPHHECSICRQRHGLEIIHECE